MFCRDPGRWVNSKLPEWLLGLALRLHVKLFLADVSRYSWSPQWLMRDPSPRCHILTHCKYKTHTLDLPRLFPRLISVHPKPWPCSECPLTAGCLRTTAGGDMEGLVSSVRRSIAPLSGQCVCVSRGWMDGCLFQPFSRQKHKRINNHHKGVG